MFLVSIVNILTDWWINDILYKIIPNIEDLLPKFNWINEYIGILSFIQMLLCILANRFYFRIKDTINKVGGEFEDTNEIV